jgi:hypothetical protein
MTPRADKPPYDVSAITEQLYLGSLPSERQVDYIRSLGVDLVLDMIGAAPPVSLTQPPFQLLRLPTFDFPLFPIPLYRLSSGVEAAMPVLDAGGKILVYCRQGRHRSVVMTCSILIARGMTADEAMDTVVARRRVADPHAFYVEPRIRAFERDWACRGASSIPASNRQ